MPCILSVKEKIFAEALFAYQQNNTLTMVSLKVSYKLAIHRFSENSPSWVNYGSSFISGSWLGKNGMILNVFLLIFANVFCILFRTIKSVLSFLLYVNFPYTCLVVYGTE